MDKELKKMIEDVEDAMLILQENVRRLKAKLRRTGAPAERIRTFEEATAALGESHPIVREYNEWKGACTDASRNTEAYFKLRIICAALNEGEETAMGKSDCHYPRLFFFTDEEWSNMNDAERKECVPFHGEDRFGNTYSGACYLDSGNDFETGQSYSLSLNSEELSEYAGKTFMELWADFYMG